MVLWQEKKLLVAGGYWLGGGKKNEKNLLFS